MKIICIGLFFLSFFYLHSSGFSEEFEQCYSAAAVHAAEGGDYSVVELLITRGADPNAAGPDGRALLSAQCMYCFEAPFNLTPVKERIQQIEFLISRGAKINAADSYGITPLLIANRIGTDELIQLLKAHGAIDPDLNDIKIKAAATLVDAELLMQGIYYLLSIDGSKSSEPTILMHEEFFRKLNGSKIKVFLNGGKDVFGRDFTLSTVGGGVIKVHPETLIELENGAMIKSDYWKRLDQRIGRLDASQP